MQVPFKIKWLHPDSGSEFINHHLYRWTKDKEIELCRSKPNNKNDNEYVEQKNYTTVRQYFGTKRIETNEAIEVMNHLYEGSLYLYINFFLPTMICIKKKRKGNKIIRIYDKAKTPFQRIMANKEITLQTKQMLLSVYRNLDPVELKKDIEDTLIKIYKLR